MRLPAGMPLAEMLSVSDQTDEAGRLLLEDSAPEPARKRAAEAGITMDTETCPYRDTPSRYGGIMNVSAYDALRRDTAEILNGFAWLAVHYLEVEPSKRSTVRCLFDVSNLGLTLPLVLFYRGRDPVPPHGHLPTYLASMFKASRGVFSAAVDMLNRRGPDDAITAEEAVRFAEEQGHLRRQATQRVCAAPTRLIERTLAAMLTGEGADPQRSGLASLMEFDRLWDFYLIQEDFTQRLSDYRFTLNHVLERAGAQDPAQLFRTPITDGAKKRTFGDVTESMLREANSAQVRLNRRLGRAENVARVQFEDLLRML